MSPIGVVGAFFVITGLLSLGTVAVWVIGSLMGWPPAVGMGPVRLPPVLVLLGTGALWLVTALELARRRKRGGFLALAGLVVGMVQVLDKGEAAAGALVFAVGCLMLLAWGWRELESR